jgi:hypothetical protein
VLHVDRRRGTTPEEADALAERLVGLVQELRARPEPSPGADRALDSVGVLPWQVE